MVHATTIARLTSRLTGRGWEAVLLLGGSGVGKSDLALRALDHGWRLVADDYTLLWASGGRLWARAPDTIAGRIEVRGVGLLPVERLGFAPVALAVDCGRDRVERLPEPGEQQVFEGVGVPAMALNPFESSALAKLSRVLSTRALGA